MTRIIVIGQSLCVIVEDEAADVAVCKSSSPEHIAEFVLCG